MSLQVGILTLGTDSSFRFDVHDYINHEFTTNIRTMHTFILKTSNLRKFWSCFDTILKRRVVD